MDLKVKTGLIGKPHHLPKNMPTRLLEDGVQNRVQELRVGLGLVVLDEDVVLDAEVRLVVLEVH